MTTLTTDAEELIKDYVLELLDENLAEEFELKILEDEVLAEEVAAAQGFAQGLKEIYSNHRQEKQLTSKIKPSNEQSFWSWLKHPIPVVSVGLVSALLGVVFLPFLMPAEKSPQPNLISFSTTSVRSASRTGAKIKLEQGGPQKLLIIKVPQPVFESSSEFKLTVNTAPTSNNLHTWESESFSLNPERMAVIELPKTLSGQFHLGLLSFKENKWIAVAFCSPNEPCKN